MDYRYENINFGNDIPVKCFVHHLGRSARHWHGSLELLFVASGRVTIYDSGECLTLEKGDIYLVNSNSPHELFADDAILTTLQIRPSLFGENIDSGTKLHFECNTRKDPENPGYAALRKIVGDFIRAYASNQPGRLYRAKGLCYMLLSVLMDAFQTGGDVSVPELTQSQHERITRIIEYINEHFSEPVSLASIAAREYLSVPYLSKLFHQTMGVGFAAYLSRLRLFQAVSDLGNTGKSIDVIAESNGFPNTQSFVNAFRKQYDMLPSQWRREHPAGGGAGQTVESFNDYTILNMSECLNIFADTQGSDTGTAYISTVGRVPDVRTACEVDVRREGEALHDKWRRYIGVGSALDLLNADIRSMLTELQNDIGYRYVKFHGILSDDMHVCTRGRDGKLSFSFIYVDKALDFLISIGLKPLVQLSFMPAALAAQPEKQIFESSMINSAPARMDEWLSLIRAFVIHLADRYGEGTVEKWPFTVWNEPDTPTSMFGFDSDEEFYLFYRATREIVLEVCPGASIGSPSTYFDRDANSRWNSRFLKWCAQNGCVPDFILFHFYGTVIDQNVSVYRDNRFTMGQLQLTKDPDLLRECIGTVLDEVRDAVGKDIPVYMTEWNYSPSHRDLLGDTCFRSCYIVKNVLENFDRLEAMGYWLLTDLFEEHQVPSDIFHGGLGLFTYNGIKKPAYYAFRLLKKLGNELLDRGDGWFVTKRGRGYQVMLYNYRHYSDLYAECEAFDVGRCSRYTPFAPEQYRSFEIDLTGMPSDMWNAGEYILNREHGSAYDIWAGEMNGAEDINEDEVRMLKGLSHPLIRRYPLKAEDGKLHLSALLKPLEVRLILLKPEERQEAETPE